MLLDLRKQAPVELYKPYALVHNSLNELWEAAEVIHALPCLYDDKGHLSSEVFAMASTRLAQIFGNVANFLTAGQELLTAGIPWFALGSELPIPSFRYRTLYQKTEVLRASTIHELAYSLAEAVVLDLSTQTSKPFSGFLNSRFVRLQDKTLLTESFAALAKDKWQWPLFDAYQKRHRHLIHQLRREFLRAWAQAPFMDSSSGELPEEFNLKETPQEKRSRCYDRDEYFVKLKEENGMKPADICAQWNGNRDLRKKVCPGCSNPVKLDTVVTQIKRFKKLRTSDSGLERLKRSERNAEGT